MTSVVKSRAIRIFENYLHSPNTRAIYTIHVNSFVKWANLPNWECMLEMSSKELKIIIEDYVMHKRSTTSFVYCKTISFGIQAFLESNDYDGINWKKIRRLMGKDDKKKTSRPWTTEEIKRMLEVAKSLRNKSLILFLSSSGVRRGAIPNMKMKDLKDMPLGCKAVTVYSETSDEYITFINQEASIMLAAYFERRKSKGEIITPESYVFASDHTTRLQTPVTEGTISYLIQHIKEQAGFVGNGVDNQLCHAFRRRFDTVFKLRDDCNVSLVERLMGHSTTVILDNSYFQPTTEDLFKEYQKGTGDLTIDDSERLRTENEQIKNDLDQLQQEKQSNRELSKRLDNYEQNQSELLRVMNLLQNGNARLKNSPTGEVHVTLVHD